uniref:Arrestin-like N-terminal domain-containing protein n=1 Tax=Neogobius melanostomus TaxID=47308 RepID=A0A8C6UPF4_9GOBI
MVIGDQSVREMSPIQDFKVKYEAVNKENTFSAGDTIKGMVTFTLTKETKIKCLYVKAKGDAHVHWTDSQGHGDHQNNETHHTLLKYCTLILLLHQPTMNLRYLTYLDILSCRNIPPSFKGCSGNIVHVLQAKMSRSWHTSSSDKKELNFVSRTFLPLDQVGLSCEFCFGPQYKITTNTFLSELYELFVSFLV